MPKRVLQIPGFDRGTYGNISRRDVPDGYAALTENVDGSVVGKVRGVRRSEQVSATFDPRIMITKSFGSPEIIGQDALRQVKSFDITSQTETNIGSPTTDYISTMVSHNKNIFMGTTTAFKGTTPGDPLVVVDIDKQQFGQFAATGRSIETSALNSYQDIQTGRLDAGVSPNMGLFRVGNVNNPIRFSSSRGPGTENDGENFLDSASYYYGFSLVYDGFMESPLVKGYFNDGDELVYFQAVPFSNAEFAHGFFQIGVITEGDLSRRVTGFNIYRAENPNVVTKTTGPTSAYRFVRHLDINKVALADASYEELSDVLQEDMTSTQSPIDTVGTTEVGDTIQIGSEKMIVNSVDDVSGDIFVTRGALGTAAAAHSTGDFIKTAANIFVDNGGAAFENQTIYDASYHAHFKDDGTLGATYEERTGVAETVESTVVKYRLSTAYNSQLFVGGCQTELIDDASRYIFRSAPQFYSSFNPIEDFVILPEEPIALGGFGGRIYAFSETNMYRINPQGLFVEDDFKGVGALNENMVVVTNFGMFHADENNIYLNDGTRSTPIGTPILRVTTRPDKNYGWLAMAKTVAGSGMYARLAFDTVERRLLVFGATETDGSETVCWAYSLDEQRWDLYTSLEMPLAVANIPNGTLYITTGVGELRSLFTSATRYNWVIKTKDYSLGNQGYPKWFYRIDAVGSGQIQLLYEVDESGIEMDPDTIFEDGLRTARVPEADREAKSLSVSIQSNLGSDELDMVHILYRPPVISI